MERKQRIELILAVCIVLAVMIVVLALVLKKDKGPIFGDPNREILEAEVPEGFDPNAPLGDPILSPEPTMRIFVERFGSFSTESDYKNIDDVLVLATPEFESELQTIARAARAEVGEEYYGISTRVIGFTQLEQTATTAKYEVVTQRSESIGSPENTSVRYQEILVDTAFVNGDWLISGFTWQ